MDAHVQYVYHTVRRAVIVTSNRRALWFVHVRGRGGVTDFWNGRAAAAKPRRQNDRCHEDLIVNEKVGCGS